MPNLTLGVGREQGALVEVAVAPSQFEARARTAAGLPRIYPKVVFGLIDTGAAITVIDEELARQLELNPTGEVLIRSSTAQQPSACATYAIHLQLTRPTLRSIAPTLQVACGKVPVEGVGLLLGRDVLARCVFIYNGPASQFTLAF